MKKTVKFFLWLCPIVVAVSIGYAQEATPEAEGMTFLQLLKAGGPVMYPLYLCSLITITFFIHFLFNLRIKKVLPPKFITQIKSNISNGNIKEAIDACKNNHAIVAPIFLVGLQNQDKPEEKIRDEMTRQGAIVMNKLKRTVEILNIMGIIAPMLGLLGTVTGMIECFMTIAYKGGLGNPRLLASGISEALVTTATGLPIGIIALSCYIYFRDKADAIVTHVENTSEELITLLKESSS